LDVEGGKAFREARIVEGAGEYDRPETLVKDIDQSRGLAIAADLSNPRWRGGQRERHALVLPDVRRSGRDLLEGIVDSLARASFQGMPPVGA
jgi:hypothetical protein